MITIPTRQDQALAVFGLGASGRSTARALAASGAAVAAWDDDSGRCDAAADDGLAVTDLLTCDWSGFDGLVLSPGVPLTHPQPHPVARRARDAGCPIIGDIELLAEACPEATLVGITGTNGKSTTTALIGHVLAETGRRVEVGGNLGPPALGLDPLGKDGIYALGLSSYQLDLTLAARFDIAVFLNLTPDHLDRHGGIDGYLAAKRRIFRNHGKVDERGLQVAMIGLDDDYGMGLVEEMKREAAWRVIPISSGSMVSGGVFVINGQLMDLTEIGNPNPLNLSELTALPGAHNWQNAAAAYAVALTLGVTPEEIADAFRTFPGLPHRQELVATVGGVRYVNDSKATNAEAASRAIASYDRVYLIAGGLAKEGGLETVLPMAGRIRHAGPLLDAEARPIGSLVLFEADSLEEAQALAARDPYVTEGVFESHEVLETRQVFPK